MIYRSFYKDSLDYYIKFNLSEIERGIFNALYYGFGIPQKLECDFFKLIRLGDDKYNLIVQKYSNGQYCIKFYKNRNK